MPKRVYHEGKLYEYEHKLASNGDLCLATTDPESYCNGVYKYSDKDPGSGKCFVVVATDDMISIIPKLILEEQNNDTENN